jgi:voltage-gated potassium channel
MTWRKRTEWPLLLAALILLVAYSIEVIGNLSGTKAQILDAVIWVTWALFIIDYVVNLVLAERRLRWFVRNLHELVILTLPVLRPLRLLRLIMLLRLMERFGSRALRGRVVVYVIGSAVLLTYVGALAVLDAEQNVPGSNIRNFGDALWWALVTITTVGYGDHYPVTLVGRLVAAGLMIGGIAVIGVVAAALASWLVDQVGSRAAAETRDAEEPLQRKLDAMESKLDRLTALLEQEGRREV